MELLVIEHGKRRTVPTKALLPGKEGNLQTLAELLPMIRRDVFDEELRNRALELIADCPNEFECQVGKLFDYAKSIRYVRDPIDAERIADAATTIAVQAGDCGDKSELLAAMLGTIGYVTRLRALNFYDDLDQRGYDHLLVQVQRDDGSWVSLDATPEWARPYWEPEAPVKTDFDIWTADGRPATVGQEGKPSPVGLLPRASAVGSRQSSEMAGWVDDLIAQGIQLGTQYAAGAVQQARLSGAQAQQAGGNFDNAAGQVTQIFNAIQSQPVITEEDLAAAVNAYQQLAQLAQQYGSVEYVAQQWASEDYKPAYEARLRQMAESVSRRQEAGGSNQSGGPNTGGLLSSVPSVTSLFSNPLAIVAVGLLGWAVIKR